MPPARVLPLRDRALGPGCDAQTACGRWWCAGVATVTVAAVLCPRSKAVSDGLALSAPLLALCMRMWSSGCPSTIVAVRTLLSRSSGWGDTVHDCHMSDPESVVSAGHGCTPSRSLVTRGADQVSVYPAVALVHTRSLYGSRITHLPTLLAFSLLIGIGPTARHRGWRRPGHARPSP
jgi:hypothetical protein